MKNLLRRIICGTARDPWLYRHMWHPLDRLTRLASREQFWQELTLGEELQHAETALVNQSHIASGPFKGMIYPDDAAAIGSTLYSKLIGSYEQELHSVVEATIQSQPDVVLDIGCAEGYYAVGLAMRLPQTSVIAFDTVREARQRCSDMAESNGVGKRLSLQSFCTSEALDKLKGRNGFVWCDCEGYERILFSPDVARSLNHSTLLIETHDFIRPYTLKYLKSVFQGTHDLTVIRSVPDPLRPVFYPNTAIAHYSVDVQTAIMAEWRPADMTWLWCRSKLQ